MHGRTVFSTFALAVVFATGCTTTGGALWTTKSAKSEEVVHKPETYVAFGDFRLMSAAAKETSPDVKSQHRAEAKEAYAKAIALDAKCVKAHEGMARLMQLNEDHAGAVASLKKLTEIDPKSDQAHHALALCLCRCKRYDDAVVAIKKAQECAPGHKGYAAALGYIQARAGRFEESLATLTAVHGEAKARYDLARMLWHMEKPDEARRQAALALKANPNQDGVKQLLATMDNPQGVPADVRTVEHTEAAPPAAPEASAPTPIAPALPGVTTIPTSVPAAETAAVVLKEPAPLPTIITGGTPAPMPVEPAGPTTIPDTLGEAKSIRLPPTPVSVRPRTTR